MSFIQRQFAGAQRRGRAGVASSLAIAAGLSQIGEFSFLIGSRVGAQAAALDRGLQLDLQRDGAVVGAEDVVADARGAHAVGD